MLFRSTIDQVLGQLLPELSDQDPDSLFEQAIRYLPQAVAAKHQLQGMKSNYKVSMGSFFPYIGLYGGYRTNYFEALKSGSENASYKNQFRNNAGEYVGIQISIPIFSQLTKLSNRRRAKYRLQMQQADYEETLLRLHQDIKQGITDLNGAAKEYIQDRKSVG